MAIVNEGNREINAKVVYYGPGLSGKTTNIVVIHKKLNPENRGKLVSLATQTDRTLFFDFLPIDLGEIGGFTVRFHLYTVPGQVYYNTTRKMVLKGVDGVVFVADSRRSRMEENVESLKNLGENLAEFGKAIDSIPLVLQYNKRDLSDAADLEDLHARLNGVKAPFFQAVATEGTGVIETLTAICRLVMSRLRDTRIESDAGDGTAGGLPGKAARSVAAGLPDEYSDEAIRMLDVLGEGGDFAAVDGASACAESAGDAEDSPDLVELTEMEEMPRFDAVSSSPLPERDAALPVSGELTVPVVPDGRVIEIPLRIVLDGRERKLKLSLKIVVEDE